MWRGHDVVRSIPLSYCGCMEKRSIKKQVATLYRYIYSELNLTHVEGLSYLPPLSLQLIRSTRSYSYSTPSGKTKTTAIRVQLQLLSQLYSQRIFYTYVQQLRRVNRKITFLVLWISHVHKTIINVQEYYGTCMSLPFQGIRAYSNVLVLCKITLYSYCTCIIILCRVSTQ